MYLRKMFQQSSHYFLGHALSIFAGLISFPIYTRLFSASEYGLLSIISTTVFFVMAFAKFGIQNSFIRFFDEIKNNKKSVTLLNYYSTLFFGPVITVAGISLLYLVTVLFLNGRLIEEKAVVYFAMSAVWTFFLCSNILIKSFLRAEQNTLMYNVVSIFSKYCSLVLGIILVYSFFKSLFGLYLAFIITEALIFIFLAVRLHTKYKVNIKHFNKTLFLECLSYGFPLVGMELTSIILNAGDRYVLLYFLGTAAVGIYSAGYDLAMHAMEGLIIPLSFVIMPIYMRIWTERGEKETSEFLSKCLKYFLLVALPCILGFNYLSKDLTILLASRKFENAYKIAPYVSSGVLFYGLTNIFNAGLFIKKRTALLTFWTVAAGALNVILNILFVPAWGVIGAAAATLIAYFLLFLILSISAFRYLSFKIEYTAIFKYFVFSALMIYFIGLFKIEGLLANIIIKGVSGVICYLVLLYVFDKDIKNLLGKYISKLGGQSESSSFIKSHNNRPEK